jgi:hypothetical protein
MTCLICRAPTDSWLCSWCKGWGRLCRSEAGFDGKIASGNQRVPGAFLAVSDGDSDRLDWSRS